MKRLRCAPACESGAAHVRRACQSCVSRGTFRAGFEKVLEKYEFSRVKVGRIAYVELSFRDNANASHCVSSHPPCYAVRFTSGTAYLGSEEEKNKIKERPRTTRSFSVSEKRTKLKIILEKNFSREAIKKMPFSEFSKWVLFFAVSPRKKAAARHLDRKLVHAQEVEKIRRLAVGTRRRQPYCSL